MYFDFLYVGVGGRGQGVVGRRGRVVVGRRERVVVGGRGREVIGGRVGLQAVLWSRSNLDWLRLRGKKIFYTN